MLVAVQVSVLGLYLPPVLAKALLSCPPQTIISLPVQTAVCRYRPKGALAALVAVQLCVSGASRCPTVGAGIVSPAGVDDVAIIILPAPDDHFVAGPHWRVKDPRAGGVGNAGGCPSVGAGIISAAGVGEGVTILPAPDDHFAAGPDCGVIGPATRCVRSAGRCPSVGTGIVSSAGVQIASAAPDDHFAAGPDCGVILSDSGGVSGASRCPTVGARVVFGACVQSVMTIKPAPDDHFAAGPGCGVLEPRARRVIEGGGYPRIIGAWTNLWKSVRSFVQIRGIDAVLRRDSRVGCEQASRRRRYACHYSWISDQAFR